MTDLTAQRLRDLFTYDRSSGNLIRLKRTARCVRVGDVAGSLSDEGYLVVQIDGKSYKAHRLAWLHETGEWPPGDIDHRDGNRTNNRWANLRPADRSLNMQNQRRARSDNKSGLLGVGRGGNRWRASIGISGKAKHIGLFDTPELAHLAYLSAKRRLHEGCTL